MTELLHSILLSLPLVGVFVVMQHRLVPTRGFQRWMRNRGFRHWRGYLSVGLMALLGIAIYPWFDWPPHGTLDISLYALGVWTGLSILWSEDRFATARATAILGTCAFLALAVASVYDLEARVSIISGCSLIFILISLAVTRTREHFLNPHSGRYGGSLLPNQQACVLVFGILSIVCLVELDKLPSIVGFMLVSVLLLLLLLTNTSSEVYSGLAASLVWAGVSLVTTAEISWLVGFVPVGYLIAHFIVNGTPKFRRRAAHVEWAFEHHPVMAHVNLGKDPRKITQLTGRVPIWRNLLPFMRKHPLIGYGYDGFWSPQHREALASWHPRNSHSLYLDIAIGLGLAGLALLAVVGVAALTTFSALPYPLVAFLLSLMVFVVITSIADSIFLLGGFESFVVFLLCFHL